MEVAKKGVTEGDAKYNNQIFTCEFMREIFQRKCEKNFMKVHFADLFFIGLLSSAASVLNIRIGVAVVRVAVDVVILAVANHNYYNGTINNVPLSTYVEPATEG